MQQQQSTCYRRIVKDLKELEKSPQKGISVVVPDESDLRTLLVNIEIQWGGYEGMVVHHIMKIPEDFPTKSPRMIIAEGQPYDSCFHGHIYQYYSRDRMQNEFQNCYGYCIDILDTVFFNSADQKTGWSPAYTFKTLFLQIQNFLADPDYWVPSQQQIDLIWEKLNKYKRVVTHNGKQFTHTNEKPYPPLPEGPFKTEEEENDIDPSQLPKEILEKITCYVTRDNIQDNEEEAFGYPLNVTQDKFGRYNIQSFPQILSYSAFLEQLKSGQERKTASGDRYNNWIPLYLTEKHFQTNLEILKQQISDIFNSRFSPDQILRVFPNILNKLTVNMFNEQGNKSIAQIEMYCQFQRLFGRLVKEFPKLKITINQKIKSFCECYKNKNKKIIPDIGEFLVQIGLSGYELSQILPNVFKEYFARQIFWMCKSRPKLNSKKAVLDYAFNQAKISNNLLMFNVKAQQILGTSEYLDSIKDRCSFISVKDAENFQNELKSNAQNIKSHWELFQYVGILDKFSAQTVLQNDYVWDWMQLAIYYSNQQGYTRNQGFYLEQAQKTADPKLTYDSLFKQYDMIQKKGTISRQNAEEDNSQNQKPKKQEQQVEEEKKQESSSNNNLELGTYEEQEIEGLFKILNKPHDIFLKNTQQKSFKDQKEIETFINSNILSVQGKFTVEKIFEGGYLIVSKAPRQNAMNICRLLIRNSCRFGLYLRGQKIDQNSKITTLTNEFLGWTDCDAQNLEETFKNLNSPHNIMISYGTKIQQIEDFNKLIQSSNEKLTNMFTIQENGVFCGFEVVSKPPRSNAKNICEILLNNQIEFSLKPRQKK